MLTAIHDINEALAVGDKFFFLKDGKIAASGDGACVNAENIKNCYGADVSIVDVDGRKIILHGGIEE